MARRDMMASSSISMSFDKATVVETLKKNRAEHETIYKEAVEGYRKAFEEAVLETQDTLVNKLSELKDKDLPSPHLKKHPLQTLTVPKNQLKEYDTVLEMLELTADDTIVLDQDQYNCYMKDNWYWMNDFLVSNSAYSATASLKLGSMR